MSNQPKIEPRVWKEVVSLVGNDISPDGDKSQYQESFEPVDLIEHSAFLELQAEVEKLSSELEEMTGWYNRATQDFVHAVDERGQLRTEVEKLKRQLNDTESHRVRMLMNERDKYKAALDDIKYSLTNPVSLHKETGTAHDSEMILDSIREIISSLGEVKDE